MNLQETNQYLNSFVNYEKDLRNADSSNFKLERIKYLLHLVGNPQKKLKAIHVAGSNGKGSVCAFTASILVWGGYKVGLYTSPHMHRVNERIRIMEPRMGGADDIFSGAISDEMFCAILSELKPHIESVKKKKEFGPLTYYEILTVMALYYFAEENADFTILEVGLGGRLDATNVVDASVCAFTSVSLEHTSLLGNTVEEIAAEKAAIIKNSNQKVVIGKMPDAARSVIADRCRQFNIEPNIIARKLGIEVPLPGEHQYFNAATAAGIVKSLGGHGVAVYPMAISKGIADTKWAGRFEVVDGNPAIILDSAHNPESSAALVKAVQDRYPNMKIILILGVSNDKDVKSICKELNKLASIVITAKTGHPRSLDPKKVNWGNYFINKEIIHADTVEKAMMKAQELSKGNEIILVTGSIFTVAEARDVCISTKV